MARVIRDDRLLRNTDVMVYHYVYAECRCGYNWAGMSGEIVYGTEFNEIIG